MNHPPAPTHLRLVAPARPDARASWTACADRDARAFITRHGHALSDPSLAAWVIEECAELAWDAAPAEQRGSWSSLRLPKLWLRISNMHRFFPQPRLVIAYYDTLRVFLPWLSMRGLLEREHAVRMLEELDRVGLSMLERAREQLVARHRASLHARR
jgi:hypothetical protein